MGDARRRGSYQQRKQTAIKRNKKMLVQQMGDIDERSIAALEAGLSSFLSKITKEEWAIRRGRVLEDLNGRPEEVDLAKAVPVRVRADEIGWYLFLCEQTLNDPMCVDSSQAQRILPFIAGIGERWKYVPKVEGMERKIDEVLTKYKAAPDGLIFEILVALSYAEHGWDVELLKENVDVKTPDMVVRKDGREFYIECKRLQRTTDYSATERAEFLRLWDAGKQILIQNGQWVWLKGTFHVEAASLPTDFLAKIFQKALPLRGDEELIHNNTDATIYARLIDRHAVRQHMDKYHVKMPSPSVSWLLGGDWAPMNSAVTVAHEIKVSHVVDCEAPVLGTYIDEIVWACGFTREFDSEVSVDKKARDVTKLLSKAVKQVPKDKQSIIHLAAETLEGGDVERRRTEKVMKTIPTFVTSKPVAGIRFHRFQSNQRTDKLYELDETVNMFQRDGVVLDGIPTRVVVPSDVETLDGNHWEIYQ